MEDNYLLPIIIIYSEAETSKVQKLEVKFQIQKLLLI